MNSATKWEELTFPTGSYLIDKPLDNATRLLIECCFAAEDVVVVLGEAVRFVADVLQKA